MRRFLTVLLVFGSIFFTFSAHATVNESYIHIQITDSSEIGVLTRVVSIADVQGFDVYAFATNPMLNDLQRLGYAWQVLDYPGRKEKIKMAASIDEFKKNWQCYPTYDQYVALMQSFAAQHSDICRLVEIGKSSQGRALLALKITDNPKRSENEPVVFYTATMHGNEPVGYVLMLRLIDDLLNRYNDGDERIKKIVNNVELWINPLANPDGTYAGGNDTVKLATRSNAQGINLNRNFPAPEIYFVGNYLHPDGSVDWAVETKAFMSFADSHNITLSANFHSGREVVNYPWDCTAELHPDDNWFQTISRKYALQAQADGPNNYMTDLNDGITNGYAWFQVFGSRQDYMVYYQGSPEVTIELYSKYLLNGNELDIAWQANRNAMLAYIENVLQ